MKKPENNPTAKQAATRIQLYFTTGGVSDELLKGSRAVVIDVLRTAASIVEALDKKAKYVIPAPSVDAASNLVKQIPRDDVLLCGEHEAKPIDGFDLGNSPSEYTYKRVREQRLIYVSTNGSPALLKCAAARSVYLCGFINLNAVIDILLEQNSPFPLVIVCSGNNNQFSLEDAVCGGVLINRIHQRIDKEFDLNDGARAAKKLAIEFGDDIPKLLNETRHGQYLKSIGYKDDLALCAVDSVYSVVPVLRDGRLVALSSK